MRSVRLALSLVAASTLACSSSSPPSNPGPDSGEPDVHGADVAPPKDSGGGGGDTSKPPSEGAATDDTWDNYAKAFFKTYCVECHNATTPYSKQDFTIYADVIGLEKTIRCGVAPKGMVQSGCPTSGFPPPGQFPISNGAGTNPKPSNADRLRIIAWINAGAPE
jgi:hypothetical protein